MTQNFNNLTNEISIIKNNLEKSSINLPSGKMLRSLTGILIIKALGISCSYEYTNFLTAIELIHNSSLLHDDVIDNEKMRRNNQTLNTRTDNKTAILYGNLLLTDAVEYLLKTKSLNILSITNAAIKNMCKGELLQKSQEYKIPKPEDYINKTRLKTASLFTCMTNGISELSQTEHQKELENFAENFGIAFQIKNDLENSSNSDIKNGIYTAPVIFSKSLSIKQEAIEKTISLIDNYSKRAEHALEFLRDSDYKKALIGVIKCLKN